MIGVLRSALGETATKSDRDSSPPKFGAGLGGGSGANSPPPDPLLGKSVSMDTISSCCHSSPRTHEGDGNHNVSGDGNEVGTSGGRGGYGTNLGDISRVDVGNRDGSGGTNGRSGGGGGHGGSTLTTKRTSSFDRLERLVMNKTPPTNEDVLDPPGASGTDEARSGRSGSVGSGSRIHTAAAPGLTTASTKAW